MSKSVFLIKKIEIAQEAINRHQKTLDTLNANDPQYKNNSRHLRRMIAIARRNMRGWQQQLRGW